MKSPRPRAATQRTTPAALVVLVGEAPDWQAELGAVLGSEGYITEHVAQLEGALEVLAGRAVRALFLGAERLAASDLLLLRRIGELSPGTSIVAVTRTPSDPDLKRAFESGATAFLSWPASNVALRQAIDPEMLRTSKGQRR
jgi:CheY-like chemotaxis protein